jgi:hypothetical protein
VAASDYERSVFINCPFDAEFEPLFHSIVLTVAARGFLPRSARQTEGQAETRISRIARGILEAKYSIHDLSRYQGEGAGNLARFNMPLELGIALGIQYLGDIERRISGNRHNWVVLVPANALDRKFISDLSGYDHREHDRQPMTVIKAVASWLSLQPGFLDKPPSASTIFNAYPGFRTLLEQARAEGLGDLNWPAITRSVETAIANMPV